MKRLQSERRKSTHLMTRFAFKTPERLEVGIHPAKVPEFAVVVVRAGDDTGPCRVNREGRHSLLFAIACVSGLRPSLSPRRARRPPWYGLS